MCLVVNSLGTLVSTLQGAIGCSLHPLKFVPKVKKSNKNKALSNIRRNFGGATVNEQNMTGMLIEHKGKCPEAKAGKGKHSMTVPFTKSLNREEQ